jgi:hypothetical protein
MQYLIENSARMAYKLLVDFMPLNLAVGVSLPIYLVLDELKYKIENTETWKRERAYWLSKRGMVASMMLNKIGEFQKRTKVSLGFAERIAGNQLDYCNYETVLYTESQDQDKN